tara:strand:+ start:1717 stop:2217 length:501 start_codon:yes stop_codon:yes gene_type:complete
MNYKNVKYGFYILLIIFLFVIIRKCFYYQENIAKITRELNVNKNKNINNIITENFDNLEDDEEDDDKQIETFSNYNNNNISNKLNTNVINEILSKYKSGDINNMKKELHKTKVFCDIQSANCIIKMTEHEDNNLEQILNNEFDPNNKKYKQYTQLADNIQKIINNL